MLLLYVTHPGVTFREHMFDWKCACIQRQLLSILPRLSTRTPLPRHLLQRFARRKIWERKREKLWTGLSPYNTWVKLIVRSLAQQLERGIRQPGSTTADSFCDFPIQTRQSRYHYQDVQRTAAVLSSVRPPPH